MNLYPVYIPSKGRAGKVRTVPLLQEAGVSFYIVVEPQDYTDYADAYPDVSVIQMPINNGGISYVRRFCKDHSIEAGDKRHWQLDDDIRKFYTYESGKKVVGDAGVILQYCESFVDRYSNVAIASLMDSTFGFKLTEPFKRNKQCAVCVLVLNQTEFTWRVHTTGEDTDYSLQALSLGWCTILFQMFQYLNPTPGTTQGGLFERYSYDQCMARIRELQSLWGTQVVKIENRYGTPRPDLRHIWRKFATPLVKVADVDS